MAHALEGNRNILSQLDRCNWPLGSPRFWFGRSNQLVARNKISRCYSDTRSLAHLSLCCSFSLHRPGKISRWLSLFSSTDSLFKKISGGSITWPHLFVKKNKKSSWNGSTVDGLADVKIFPHPLYTLKSVPGGCEKQSTIWFHQETFLFRLLTTSKSKLLLFFLCNIYFTK